MVRPVTVTAGCYLLAGIGATRFVLGLGALIAVPELQRTYSDVTAARHALLFGIWSLALGCFYVTTAYLAALGARWARIASWVVAVVIGISGGGTAAAAVVDLVGWYAQLTRVVSALTLVFALASVVLLLLPPSRRFFKARRRRSQEARYYGTSTVHPDDLGSPPGVVLPDLPTAGTVRLRPPVPPTT